ncbi:MAG: lipoyl(octanoyl) transferase [Terriglobales bacterium]
MISVVQLGRLDYAAGLRLQQKLVGLRKAGQVGDVLLLLEHAPVITLGRNAKAANVLASPELLATRGVEVYECDRGGDVTFHGPGQLVGYPIFDLRGFSRQPSVGSCQAAADRSQVAGLRSQEQAAAAPGVTPSSTRKTLGAVDYVRRLEEVLIRTCAGFGIPTKRVAGLTGVWTEAQGPLTRAEALARDDKEQNDTEQRLPEEVRREAKIAAIGVHISRSVTSHGFALNVNTDLSFFDLIVPCGIAAKPVTSIERELGREVEMVVVAESVSRNFGSVFGSQMLWVETVDALLGNAVGVPVKTPAELRRLHGEEETTWA